MKEENTRVPSPPQFRPKVFLVITNISKRNNIRSLLMTAVAFGCYGILMVGQKSFDIDDLEGSKDIPNQIRQHCIMKTKPDEGKFFLRRFEDWEACKSFLVDSSIRLVGVEIHEKAKSVEDYFSSEFSNPVDTAFIMGNEGTGLNSKHLKSCDAFLQIPQYGNGTASLNVNVAASIILHRFYQMTRRTKAIE